MGLAEPSSLNFMAIDLAQVPEITLLHLIEYSLFGTVMVPLELDKLYSYEVAEMKRKFICELLFSYLSVLSNSNFSSCNCSSPRY